MTEWLLAAAIALLPVLCFLGALVWLAGIMADLTAVNRRLLEELVERQRERGLEGPS